MLTKLKRRCALTLMILVAAASLMLLTAEACAWQGKNPELKIVDLQGDPILRIDVTGSVFNDLDRKAAVINDREGTVTLLRDQKNRFMAAIVILPFLGSDEAHVMLPRQAKNTDRDPATRRQPQISISSNGVFVDRSQIPKADFDSR